jgi:hypothetical protein
VALVLVGIGAAGVGDSSSLAGGPSAPTVVAADAFDTTVDRGSESVRLVQVTGAGARAADQPTSEQIQINRLRDEIAELQEALNSSRQFAAPDSKPRDARTIAIETALDGPTNMEFPGNPLKDVVDYLSEIHNVPILLDEAALSEAGVAPDTEMTLVISDISVRNALEILLDSVNLDYVVEHQALKITTREKADQTLDTRVYSLRALENSGFDSYSVANVIRKTIEPASWAHIEIVPEQGAGGMEGMMGMGMAGGTPMGGMGSGMGPAGLGSMQINRTQSSGLGTIEALPGCLVITQCQRVHRAVADLLVQLKAQAAEAGAGSGGAAGAFDSGFGGPQPSGGNPFYSPPGGAGSSPGAGTGGPGAAAVAPDAGAAIDLDSPRLIRGTIRVLGELAPRPPLVPVVGNTPDTKHLTDPIPDETVVVGPDGGLANCFVYLDALPEGLSTPPISGELVAFQSQGLQFVPHALVVRAGQRIQMGSKDPVVVSIRDSPYASSFFNQVFRSMDSVERAYDRAEKLPVRIKSDIHPWMSAWVLPLDHPWAAVTDEEGRFELPELPPGEYTFKVWHEKAGYIDRQLAVTVTGEEVQELQLTVDSSKFDNP